VRVLVTGSRSWTDDRTVQRALADALIDCYPETLTVVHGACPNGPDAVAGRWVANLNVTAVRVEPHPADWDRHGKAAGFRRNAEMVQTGADLCLAFIRDRSRGASHCAALAEKAGIPTKRWTA
jgi:hypothetical protein